MTDPTKERDVVALLQAILIELQFLGQQLREWQQYPREVRVQKDSR